MSHRRILATAIALLMFVVAGCKDDDSPRATLTNIWPHEDGTTWSFEMDYKVFPTDERTEPDALPSMESLHALLLAGHEGEPTHAESALYELGLSGMMTTESGVVAQRLVTRLEPLVPVAGSRSVMAAPAHQERLLRMVAVARPDLRHAVEARLGAAPAPMKTLGVEPPFLLGGEAFSREKSGYYGYGDLDRNHSWVYMEGPLRAGRTFNLQLVPALADDIWLHGRIWSVKDAVLDGVRYENLVECMYVLDMGVQAATNEDGSIQLSARSFMYGIIWYCPGVGPVGAKEAHVIPPNYILSDDDGWVTRVFHCRRAD